MTALSEPFGVSRPTVYAAGDTAYSMLESHVTEPLSGSAGALTVRVDERQLQRAVVALRVMAPHSLHAYSAIGKEVQAQQALGQVRACQVKKRKPLRGR